MSNAYSIIEENLEIANVAATKGQAEAEEAPAMTPAEARAVRIREIVSVALTQAGFGIRPSNDVSRDLTFYPQQIRGISLEIVGLREAAALIRGVWDQTICRLKKEITEAQYIDNKGAWKATYPNETAREVELGLCMDKIDGYRAFIEEEAAILAAVKRLEIERDYYGQIFASLRLERERETAQIINPSH